MMYRHRMMGDHTTDLTLGKIVCVGRNFADHAQELNNPIPNEPLLFIKPASAAVVMEQHFAIPSDAGSVHFETEMAILIGQPLTHANDAQVQAAIAGIGLGLDLTLRDVQNRLKAQGHPWERAKAFDGACPLSAFIASEQVDDLQQVGIRLTVNGERRQEGNSRMMLNPVVPLISHISHHFTLMPGDVVMTGTPAGVGEIASGDQLMVELVNLLCVETAVL